MVTKFFIFLSEMLISFSVLLVLVKCIRWSRVYAEDNVAVLVRNKITEIFNDFIVKEYQKYKSSTTGDKDQTFQVNPQLLHKSVVNFGHMTPRLLKKLKHGLCMDILVYGGSSSCGHGIRTYAETEWEKNSDGYRQFKDDPISPGRAFAYPALLQHYLNEVWPCVREVDPLTRSVFNMSYPNPQLLDSSTENLNQSLTHIPGTHFIDNQCKAAVGTPYWYQHVLQDMNVPQPKYSPDLILLEAGINDVIDDPASYEYCKQYSETFVQMIGRLPNKPSLLYVDIGERLETWRGETVRKMDAGQVHYLVTKYYDVPHISMVDGLGPFYSNDAVDWYQNFYRAGDSTHISKTGHRIVATVILNLLYEHTLSVQYPLFNGATANVIDYTTQKMLFISPVDLETMYNRNPVRFDFVYTDHNNDRLTMTHDTSWELTEEVKGKKGFSSRTIGSHVTITIAPRDVSAKIIFGKLYITTLMSYEHMGSFRVTLSRTLSDSSKGASFQESKVFDSLWSEHTSELETHLFILDPTKLKANHLQETSLIIDIEVVNSSPERVENKIKLTELSFF